MPETLDQSVDIAAPARRAWDLVSTSAGLSGWLVDSTVARGKLRALAEADRHG